MEEKWGFSLGLIREEVLPNVRFYRNSPFQLPIPDFYYKKEDFAKRRLVDVEASGTPTHLIKHFLGFDVETEDGPKCIQIITQEDHNRMKKLKNVLDPPDKAGQVTMADCMRWMMNLEARKANKFMPAGMTRDQLRLVREHAAQDSAVRTISKRELIRRTTGQTAKRQRTNQVGGSGTVPREELSEWKGLAATFQHEDRLCASGEHSVAYTSDINGEVPRSGRKQIARSAQSRFELLVCQTAV